MRTVEITKEADSYEYYTSNYRGVELLFGKHKETGEVYVKFTNSLAMCLGYANIHSMIILDAHMNHIFQQTFQIPRWLKVEEDGSLTVVPEEPTGAIRKSQTNQM